MESIHSPLLVTAYQHFNKSGDFQGVFPMLHVLCPTRRAAEDIAPKICRYLGDECLNASADMNDSAPRICIVYGSTEEFQQRAREIADLCIELLESHESVKKYQYRDSDIKFRPTHDEFRKN